MDHVAEYRRPKDDQGNEIIEKGCAPKTPTPSPTPSRSPTPPPTTHKHKKKKKKLEKKEKKRLKKLKTDECGSSSEKYSNKEKQKCREGKDHIARKGEVSSKQKKCLSSEDMSGDDSYLPQKKADHTEPAINPSRPRSKVWERHHREDGSRSRSREQRAPRTQAGRSRSKERTDPVVRPRESWSKEHHISPYHSKTRSRSRSRERRRYK